jgi:hypothetical protein
MGEGRVWGISRDCSVTPALWTESGKRVFFVFVNVNIVNSHLIVIYLTTCLNEEQETKNAIWRKKKEINYFCDNLFCKKTFFPCKFVITGFNTGRVRKEYKCGCTRNTFKNCWICWTDCTGVNQQTISNAFQSQPFQFRKFCSHYWKHN